MMILYNLLNLILLPIYLIFLIFRFWNKKENICSLRNRFALAQEKRPKGTLIWLHAASLGEVVIVTTLIKALANKHPEFSFLITTNTLSSGEFIKKMNLPKVSHQFVPMDNIIFVHLFLNRWRPNLAIFIESELWPCLITFAAKKCKLLLVGARLSDKSFTRWQNFPKLFRQIIDNFSLIITQSKLDLQKYQKLGTQNVIELSHPKFANSKLPFDQKVSKSLKESLWERTIFVAASTHKADEEVLLNIVTELKNEGIYPIIVLRHPERRQELANHCESLGLKFSLRSKQSSPNLSDDLYIVDTFGELGLFYSISDITFMGGSFKHGGHNLLEPAYFHNLIIVGPDMKNSQNITDDMLQEKAIIRVNDQEELLEQIIFLSQNDNIKMREKAAKFVNDKAGIIDEYLSKIEGLITYDQT